jgi:hypothetical protein
LASSILLYASTLEGQETINFMKAFIKQTIDKVLYQILSFKKDGDALEKLTFYWLQMRINFLLKLNIIQK